LKINHCRMRVKQRPSAAVQNLTVPFMPGTCSRPSALVGIHQPMRSDWRMGGSLPGEFCSAFGPPNWISAARVNSSGRYNNVKGSINVTQYSQFPQAVATEIF
jgi:hypothetical protein